MVKGFHLLSGRRKDLRPRPKALSNGYWLWFTDTSVSVAHPAPSAHLTGAGLALQLRQLLHIQGFGVKHVQGGSTPDLWQPAAGSGQRAAGWQNVHSLTDRIENLETRGILVAFTDEASKTGKAFW